MRTTDDIPFEQLPYQAFQEARKILAADREDKLSKIRVELEKLALLEKKNPEEVKGGQAMKDTKLASLRREVERLKLLADANDPLVKKRFEDGLGTFASLILHVSNVKLLTDKWHGNRRHEQAHLPLSCRKEVALI